MSSEWTDFKLGDLISVKHGYAFKSEFFSEVPTQYQLVTPGNFAIGGGFQLGKGKYYSGVIPEDYVLHKGDVVVTMTDLSRAADTLGYAAVIPKTEGTVWLHNQRVGLVEIKPGAAVQSNYLHYLLRSRDYRHHVVSGATGSTVKHTAPTRICEFRFLLPPLIEQESISTILGALDDRIALLRETNVTLEAIAQATFKSWFVDFDPVHAKQQGRAPEGMSETTAALFPDSFEESELGLVPRGWKISTLGECTSYLNRGISPKYIEDGGVIVINQKCIRDFIVDLSKARRHDPTQRKIDGRELCVGDVLVNSTGVGTLGRVAQILTLDESTIIDSHVTAVRASGDFSWNYLGLALMRKQPEIEGYGEGTTGQTELSRGKLASIKMVIPSKSILDQFDEVTVPLRNRFAENLLQAQTLATLRDTLLPRLISGQLRLPNDESELLEKHHE